MAARFQRASRSAGGTVIARRGFRAMTHPARAPRSAAKRATSLAAIVTVLGAGVLFAGCGTRERSPSGKAAAPELVVIGIDGFDWTLIDPLVAAGRMPVMQELLARGTRADLLTLVPLEKSPVIWSTIATGRLPKADEKGRGFLVDDAGGPKAYTSWHRQSRAFWNILSEKDRTVSVIGWLETWPAEEVKGAVISDYVQYDTAEREKQSRTSRRTYPETLEAEITPMIVTPNEISLEQLRPLLGSGPDSTLSNPDVRSALNDLSWIYAGDLTFTAIGCHMIEKRPTDVMAIYLRGFDAVCHKLWGDREHLAAGSGDSDRVRVLGPAVDLYLEETDRLLGRILKSIDLDRTSLLILSDHGFQGPRTGMDGAPMLGIYMHREIGTVLLAGPAAAGPGVRARGARVQDVLPTMLHMLGLPVARDLDGQVAMTLLGPNGGAKREVEEIATYETGDRPSFAAGEIDSAVSEEIADRVRSLGYVR